MKMSENNFQQSFTFKILKGLLRKEGRLYLHYTLLNVCIVEQDILLLSLLDQHLYIQV